MHRKHTKENNVEQQTMLYVCTGPTNVGRGCGSFHFASQKFATVMMISFGGTLRRDSDVVSKAKTLKTHTHTNIIWYMSQALQPPSSPPMVMPPVVWGGVGLGWVWIGL